MATVRFVRHTITPTRTHKTIPNATLKSPGGQLSWQAVRITNYSPYHVAIANSTNPLNTPTQRVAPFQQNVYPYTARTGTLQATFTYVTNTTSTSYIEAEFTTTPKTFAGVYPVSLGVVAVRITSIPPPPIVIPGSILSVRYTLPATGAQAFPSFPLKVGLLVKANNANADLIEIAAAGTVTVDSFTLSAGEGVVVPVTNANQLAALGTAGDIIALFGR